MDLIEFIAATDLASNLNLFKRQIPVNGCHKVHANWKSSATGFLKANFMGRASTYYVAIIWKRVIQQTV